MLIKLIILAGVGFLGCSYDQGFLKFPFLPNSLQWLKISTFGILMAMSFLSGNLFLQKEFSRLKMDPKMADTIVILAIVGGIAGAKIFFVIESWNEWSGLGSMWERLFSGGGLTWYGGFLLALLLIYLYVSRVVKIKFPRIIDIMVPGIAIGYAVGRLGCIVSGDGCYGVKCPYDWPAPFAMAFPHGANPWSHVVSQYGDPNVIVYNTPLFEAMFSLVLFFAFWMVRQREWINGTRFALFLIVHSIFRFFIEFIRRNPRDVFGMSQAQFVSIIVIVIAISYLLYKRVEIINLLNRQKQEA